MLSNIGMILKNFFLNIEYIIVIVNVINVIEKCVKLYLLFVLFIVMLIVVCVKVRLIIIIIGLIMIGGSNFIIYFDFDFLILSEIKMYISFVSKLLSIVVFGLFVVFVVIIGVIKVNDDFR